MIFLSYLVICYDIPSKRAALTVKCSAIVAKVKQLHSSSNSSRTNSSSNKRATATAVQHISSHGGGTTTGYYTTLWDGEPPQGTIGGRGRPMTHAGGPVGGGPRAGAAETPS